MVREGTVDADDVEAFYTDSPEEAVAHIDLVVRAGPRSA